MIWHPIEDGVILRPWVFMCEERCLEAWWDTPIWCNTRAANTNQVGLFVMCMYVTVTGGCHIFIFSMNTTTFEFNSVLIIKYTLLQPRACICFVYLYVSKGFDLLNQRHIISDFSANIIWQPGYLKGVLKSCRDVSPWFHVALDGQPDRCNSRGFPAESTKCQVPVPACCTGRMGAKKDKRRLQFQVSGMFLFYPLTVFMCISLFFWKCPCWCTAVFKYRKSQPSNGDVSGSICRYERSCKAQRLPNCSLPIIASWDFCIKLPQKLTNFKHGVFRRLRCPCMKRTSEKAVFYEVS